MRFRSYLTPLLALFGALYLVGCANIPESQRYHYMPDPKGRPPAKVTGKTNFQLHTLYSLFLVPPLTVAVDGVDALVVTEDPILLAPGTHTLYLRSETDDATYVSKLTADFKPGFEYYAKAGLYKGKGIVFFIEEKASKQRVTEGPAIQRGIKVHIMI